LTQTLIAYRSGRILTDVLTSLGGALDKFEAANALEDLRGIPGLNNLPDAAKDPSTLTVGKEVNYWCMSYNTRLTRTESLPAKWEDLLARPEWRGGNLGLANRPQLWVIQLWKAKGEEWTKSFLTRLFAELKPQLRKEGLNAIPQLVAAGEFHAAIPSSQSHVKIVVDAGAPVGYHCPEPVTIGMSDSSILRGAPNLHAAKIFVNWLLSKEGQIAQLISTQSVPIHKALQRPEFIPFADRILGRPVVYRDTKSERELAPAMTKFWNSLWLRPGAK
jgi:iron(III) transport system substrate-binding protein